MTGPERVANYLKANSPHAFCDDCLTGNVEIGSPATGATVHGRLGRVHGLHAG